MNFATAKQTVAKLFGPGLKLHRGKNRCFLLRADGQPVADGRSWLECLRSYGEVVMLRNAANDKLKAAIEEYVKITGHDPNKMNPDDLEFFDAWMEAKQAGKPTPEFKKPEAPPLVTLK